MKLASFISPAPSAPAAGCVPRRAVLALALAAALPAARAGGPATVEVWKSPTCGCCRDWIAHLEADGFRVVVHDTGNTATRARMGIPMKLGSCHTAVVAGHAIEGHVPARDIRRLLKEKPKAIGLAAPGMPIGSPGMDGPAYGGRRQAYDVLLVKAGGATSVYQSY